MATRLTVAARLVATAVLVTGCGATTASPTVTYPLTTPVPMASLTPAVAATRAELARVRGDQRLQLSDPQVRFRPAEDFPRTHTLKIKRDPVRHWASADAPLPVRDATTATPA